MSNINGALRSLTCPSIDHGRCFCVVFPFWSQVQIEIHWNSLMTQCQSGYVGSQGRPSVHIENGCLTICLSLLWCPIELIAYLTLSRAFFFTLSKMMMMAWCGGDGGIVLLSCLNWIFFLELCSATVTSNWYLTCWWSSCWSIVHYNQYVLCSLLFDEMCSVQYF